MTNSGYNTFKQGVPADTASEMKPKDFAALQKLPGNDLCVDCGAKSPDWGSPSFGILFCLKCGGVHRGLGTHISFVRSVRMDSWTPQQLKLMKQGGNKRCNDFLQSHGILQLTGDRETIQQKYDSPAAELYKEVLKAEIEGRPVPTELPKNFKPKRTQQSTAPRRKMEGFGSSPPPEPESMITGKRILYVAVPAVAVAAIWLLVPH